MSLVICSESPQPLRPNEQLQNQHMLHYQPLKQHVRYQDKQIQQKAEQSNPRDNAATWTVIIDDKSLPSNLVGINYEIEINLVECVGPIYK